MIAVDLEKVAKYSLMSTGVLASQIVVSKILPEKRSGYKFWLKAGLSTVTTVVGVSMLMDIYQNQKVVTVSKGKSKTDVEDL